MHILLNSKNIVGHVNAGESDLSQNSQNIKSVPICFDTITTERRCFFGRCGTLCKNAHPGAYLDSWCMDETTCKCQYSC